MEVRLLAARPQAKKIFFVVAEGAGKTLKLLAMLTFVVSTLVVHVVLVLLVVRHHRVVIVVGFVLRLPSHLVLLLKSSTSVGEPGGDLRQRHFGDDCQHNLLALGRVGILLVLVEPRFERRC